MGRKRFTERQVLEVALRQGGTLKCYRCGVAFTVETVRTAEREHVHEMALGGADTVLACAYSCAACHDAVTRGTGATTAGSSIGRIAKTKRIERTGKMAVNKLPPGGRPGRQNVKRIPGRVNAWPPRGACPMNRKRRA